LRELVDDFLGVKPDCVLNSNVRNQDVPVGGMSLILLDGAIHKGTDGGPSSQWPTDMHSQKGQSQWIP